MSYYDTLDIDLREAKAILARGRTGNAAHTLDGVTIYSADSYAAYKLLESFVEIIETVTPGVCTVALRLAKHGRFMTPDCICRNSVCGHRASRHQGEGGACVEPGCRCGPGGWQ